MSISELVTPQHLQKKAIIYIRQSTPHQQISNQESLRLQYALKERAQLWAGTPRTSRSLMPISA